MIDLILCEKPSQGRQVAEELNIKTSRKGYMEGNGRVVTWCFGHLLELCEAHEYDKKYAKWKMDDLPIIPDEIKYKIKPSCKEQYNIIKGLVSKSRRVIIATDGDREGEAIARSVLDRLRYKGEVKRAWITSTDSQTIREAFADLKDGSETVEYYYAARARSIMDWLIGINFSRALALRNKSKTKFKISYGRVQTVSLSIAIDREKSILHFCPITHYGLEVKLKFRSGELVAKWDIPKEVTGESGYLLELETAQWAKSHTGSQEAKITFKETKREKTKAPLPYKLSQLVKDASKHGLSPEDTKKAMQELYQPPFSLVTYPRTGCNYLPKSMFDWSREIIENATKCGYEASTKKISGISMGRCWDDDKMKGESHHAIIPTRKCPKAGELSGHNKIIYDLVMKRFLMQFMPSREVDKTKVGIDIGGLLFSCSHSEEVLPGWRVISAENDVEEDDGEVGQVSSELSIGDHGIVDGVELKKLETKRPSRLTQATLVEEMGMAAKYCSNKELAGVLKEGVGIGTEATRPDIVTELGNKKQYAVNKKGVITVPNEVIQFFDQNVPSYLKSVDSTATLEMALHAIENGQLSEKDFLAAQKKYVRETVARLAEL